MNVVTVSLGGDQYESPSIVLLASGQPNTSPGTYMYTEQRYGLYTNRGLETQTVDLSLFVTNNCYNTGSTSTPFYVFTQPPPAGLPFNTQCTLWFSPQQGGGFSSWIEDVETTKRAGAAAKKPAFISTPSVRQLTFWISSDPVTFPYTPTVALTKSTTNNYNVPVFSGCPNLGYSGGEYLLLNNALQPYDAHGSFDLAAVLPIPGCNIPLFSQPFYVYPTPTGYFQTQFTVAWDQFNDNTPLTIYLGQLPAAIAGDAVLTFYAYMNCGCTKPVLCEGPCSVFS